MKSELLYHYFAVITTDYKYVSQYSFIISLMASPASFNSIKSVSIPLSIKVIPNNTKKASIIVLIISLLSFRTIV